MRVMLALGLLALAACGGGSATPTDPPDTTAGPSSVTAPTAGATSTTAASETPPSGVPAWFGDHLAVGDCFDDAFDAEGEYDYSLPPEIVPCDGPHDNEVSGIFTIPGDDYPGEEAFEEESDRVCDEAFETYVGVPRGVGPVDGFALWPLEEEWAAGGRTAFCAVYLPTVPVAMTLRGSGTAAKPAELPDHLPVPASAEYVRLADSEDGRRFVSFVVPESAIGETVAATLRSLDGAGLTGTIAGSTGTLTLIRYDVAGVEFEVVVRVPDDGDVRWEAYYPPP